MSENKLDEQLDEILRQSLREYSVAVPDDFTAKISKQIREEHQRRILAKVVLQERLALAGCIILGVIAVVFAVIFPDITGIFILMMTWIDGISQAIESLYYQPQ